MPARTVTTWTLEMTTRPELAATLPDGVRIDLAENITPEFARYLYAVVGGPWTWTDRLGWTREQWLADLGVTGTETYVAYVGGEPAGYVQIQPTPVGAAEARGRASVEIRYFGLVETAIERGLGRTLLAEAYGDDKVAIAVGTTSVRSLESAAQAAKNDLIEPFFGDTQIFIYPGYQYKVIDALVTNFHLPESTLILLVSAFAGYQHTMNAYKAAVEQKYRFFSYGDAMFITYNPQAIFERP